MWISILAILSRKGNNSEQGWTCDPIKSVPSYYAYNIGRGARALTPPFLLKTLIYMCDAWRNWKYQLDLWRFLWSVYIQSAISTYGKRTGIDTPISPVADLQTPADSTNPTGASASWPNPSCQSLIPPKFKQIYSKNPCMAADAFR